MANWIKLFLNVEKNKEYFNYKESMRRGRRGRRKIRDAEDVAFARVIRLYMLLGQTKDGHLEYRVAFDRKLAEDVMHEKGDELLAIFDQMAEHGVINRELWAAANVVTTTNAIEQAKGRQRALERSRNANEKKRSKAKKREEKLEEEP